MTDINYDAWVRRSNASPGGGVSLGEHDELLMEVENFYRGQNPNLVNVRNELVVTTDVENRAVEVARVSITREDCIALANHFLMLASRTDWEVNNPDTQKMSFRHVASEGHAVCTCGRRNCTKR